MRNRIAVAYCGRATRACLTGVTSAATLACESFASSGAKRTQIDETSVQKATGRASDRAPTSTAKGACTTKARPVVSAQGTSEAPGATAESTANAEGSNAGTLQTTRGGVTHRCTVLSPSRIPCSGGSNYVSHWFCYHCFARIAYLFGFQAVKRAITHGCSSSSWYRLVLKCCGFLLLKQRGLCRLMKSLLGYYRLPLRRLSGREGDWPLLQLEGPL